jgi:hypothetical protein
MQQPFDLQNSPYTTRQSFDDEVNRVAQSQIQPGLDEVNQQERSMQSGSDRRQQELRGWYDWGNQTNTAAWQQAQQALSQMAAQQAAGGQQSQDALSAALNQNVASQANLVQNLGGQATDQGQVAALTAGNAQNQAALNAAANAQAGAYSMGLLGQNQAMNLAGIEAGKAEQARRMGLESDFENQRRDLTNQLPGLRSQSRQTLMDSEMGRQNQMFQQYLAEKELGQSAQNQTFQQWLAKQQLKLSDREQTENEKTGRSQRGLARRQFQLDSSRVNAEINKASSDKNDERSKARGERMRNGAAMINEYFKPTEAEYKLDDNGKKTNSLDVQAYQGRLNFDDALAMLRTQAGMGPIDSLTLLMNSLPHDRFFDRWRQRARRLIAGHRSARKGNPVGPSDDRMARAHGYRNP